MSGKKLAVAVLVIAVVAVVSTGIYMVSARTFRSNGVESTTITAGYPPPPLKNQSNVKQGLFWHGKGFVEVSPEYNSTVIKVLESSEEASELLREGYRVVAIKPIIKAYVSGDGSVVFNALQSIVILRKDEAVRTFLVDISSNTATPLNERTPCKCVQSVRR
ncbi:MAG: hypothetical protein QW705_06510 [Zestosphaera sp.]